MSLLDGIRARARFLYSLSKGIRRGDLFPQAGRAPLGQAPGGTTPAAHPLGNQVGAFGESVHRVPVRGLTEPVEILHLTDLHIRQEGPWLDALCGALQDLAPPDLLVLTGDVVTTGWTDQAVSQLLDALPPARLGRFAVMGNWEHWAGADPESWSALLARHDVRLLRNQTADLGSIILVGTDDHLAGESPPTDLVPQSPAGAPVVALTHSPAHAPALAGPRVSLVLSGHSHGGQVRLPLLGAGWVPMGTGPYVAGWYALGGTHLFVSRGIGWSIAPVRIACPPELARIRLEPRTTR